MIHTQQIAAPIVHTLSSQFLPTSVVVLGGVLAWKMWQQRQQTQRHQAEQADLAEQLAEMQTQLNNLQNNTETAQATPATATPTPHAATSASSCTADSGKRALFERLINENVAIRAAN